jgi:hypothetical protein
MSGADAAAHEAEDADHAGSQQGEGLGFGSGRDSIDGENDLIVARAGGVARSAYQIRDREGSVPRGRGIGRKEPPVIAPLTVSVYSRVAAVTSTVEERSSGLKTPIPT